MVDTYLDNVMIIDTSWYCLAYVIWNITDCTFDFWALTFRHYRHLLKGDRFEIMIFSNFRISRNALGSSKACKLLHAAYAGTAPLSNFL